jgi:hypothetical protein
MEERRCYKIMNDKDVDGVASAATLGNILLPIGAAVGAPPLLIAGGVFMGLAVAETASEVAGTQIDASLERRQEAKRDSEQKEMLNNLQETKKERYTVMDKFMKKTAAKMDLNI